jgi:hypothetical protein
LVPGGQRSEAVVAEALSDMRDGLHLCAGSGQLDGKRQAFEPSAHV